MLTKVEYHCHCSTYCELHGRMSEKVKPGLEDVPSKPSTSDNGSEMRRCSERKLEKELHVPRENEITESFG